MVVVCRTEVARREAEEKGMIFYGNSGTLLFLGIGRPCKQESLVVSERGLLFFSWYVREDGGGSRGGLFI